MIEGGEGLEETDGLLEAEADPISPRREGGDEVVMVLVGQGNLRPDKGRGSSIARRHYAAP